MSKEREERQEAYPLKGKCVSAGTACGTAYRIESEYPTFFRISIAREEVENEIARFRQALEKSREQYLVDKKKFESAIGREHSYIIDVHLMMLEDPQLVGAIEQRIREELDSPEKALLHVGDNLLGAYRSLDDPFFRERGSDFEEVLERIIGNLTESEPDAEIEIPDDIILVSHELGLSVLARYPMDKIKGVVVTKAGKTSHVAIVARSFQIPMISGIENLREVISTGDRIFMDGAAGLVEVGRTPEAAAALSMRSEAAVKTKGTVSDRDPCVTLDGQVISILGNTEFGSEVETAFRFGAEGIGLFRSEYIFMASREGKLDEGLHYRHYSQLARSVGDRPAVVRTLDVVQPSFEIVKAGEEGGALGMRGIRYSLQRPELFRAQLRSIIRARAHGNLKVVLPMVSSLDELKSARAIIHEIETELNVTSWDGSPTPVGILVEVPAAILILDSLAAEADFLAVGTNDLIQYTLAAGRLNEEISYLYNPLHPAILKSLSLIAKVSRTKGIPATVCGEMAAHPVYAAILAGLGFRSLSMTSIAIPEIKRRLREYSLDELESFSSELLRIEDLATISSFVDAHFGESPGNGVPANGVWKAGVAGKVE